MQFIALLLSFRGGREIKECFAFGSCLGGPRQIGANPTKHVRTRASKLLEGAESASREAHGENCCRLPGKQHPSPLGWDVGLVGFEGVFPNFVGKPPICTRKVCLDPDPGEQICLQLALRFTKEGCRCGLCGPDPKPNPN